MERIKQALDKARQERQIRQGTSDAPVPASTGQSRQDSRGLQYGQTPTISVDDDVLRENRIVTGLEPGPFTESYNLLRTQILQRFRENKWNVLAVTSPGSGAGKTLTAINLAISIAREVDYTVLLVDANLRHPWMMEHFGLPERKGLSDYLTSNAPIEELLVRPSRVEHLVLLPGGQRDRIGRRGNGRLRVQQLDEAFRGARRALHFAPHGDAVVALDDTERRQFLAEAIQQPAVGPGPDLEAALRITGGDLGRQFLGDLELDGPDVLFPLAERDKTPRRRFEPVIQAGAGSPLRWWSKNCFILIE